jgi:hypothetical protein
VLHDLICYVVIPLSTTDSCSISYFRPLIWHYSRGICGDPSSGRRQRLAALSQCTITISGKTVEVSAEIYLRDLSLDGRVLIPRPSYQLHGLFIFNIITRNCINNIKQKCHNQLRMSAKQTKCYKMLYNAKFGKDGRKRSEQNVVLAPKY